MPNAPHPHQATSPSDPAGPPAPSWQGAASLASRLLVWILLLGLLALLRSFFLLIFLTFVFAYLQSREVDRLARLIANRPLRVLLVSCGLLFLLIISGLFLAPTVKRQTELFASQFSLYIARVDQELFTLRDRYPLIQDLLPELQQEPPPQDDAAPREAKASATLALLQQLLGLEGRHEGLANMRHLLDTVRAATGQVAAITSAFLLSLLFSFLIVLDLPRLSAMVRGLEATKLRFMYLEAAPTIRDFGRVLGRALEAQFAIAIANSLLTALGITLLGFSQHVAFLSVIVFFCSFIPVAGVFISSIPICLIALQAKGLAVMLLAILMIILIHLVESYILNPRIYASYMRINPVIVLIILTIGGKIFHLWGLILGVPVCTYIFAHAIREAPSPAPVTSNEQPA